MKKFTTALLAALVVTVSISSFAGATVLTFDDVSARSGSRLLSDYGGLNWSNFNIADQSSYRDVNLTGMGSDVGYYTGAVSGGNTSYNSDGLAATISAASSFDFEGAFFTSAWSDMNAITAKGYRAGKLIYSTSLDINTKAPSWLAAEFTDIDTLTLASSKWQFAMDDFTFNDATPDPVPEPSTLLLVAAGICAATCISRRWRV